MTTPMEIPRDSFVVVASRDGDLMTWETLLPSTLESARKMAATIGLTWKNTAIARIVPVDQRTGDPLGLVRIADINAVRDSRRDHYYKQIDEMHAMVVRGIPASGELVARARAVVNARYAGADWDDLSDAIAALAGLVGGGA